MPSPLIQRNSLHLERLLMPKTGGAGRAYRDPGVAGRLPLRNIKGDSHCSRRSALKV